MNRRARHPQRFGGYVYPFPKTATVGRIDQGQDFGGTGPILAIGNAKVIRTGAPGWPGGNGVLYQLLDGPQTGKYIFVNEGLKPSVRAGQLVQAGDVIGHLIPGSSTGIEIGWADARGVPLSHSEYTEGKETRFGKAMASFLGQLKGSTGGSQKSPYATLAKGLGISIPEAKKLAESENLGEGVGDIVPGADLPGEILSGILGDIHPEALMLNIALLGGGAFLVYHGAALMLGIKKPVATPAKLAAMAP
ncbi:MAG: hypothetical protein QOF85_960 [Solirubrobacterales bacterium]|nr:hypothetical protein [Solirubrobacterales bacterium]